jgi:HK97 family phage major capsid protein
MKKIDELRQELTTLEMEVKGLLTNSEVDKAETKMVEVRNLKKQIKLQEEIETEEERKMEERKEQDKMENKNVNTVEQEYRAIAKYLLGKEDRTAASSITTTISDSGAILPEAFINQLEVLIKGYPSLKKYCHVIPVNTNTGKIRWMWRPRSSTTTP